VLEESHSKFIFKTNFLKPKEQNVMKAEPRKKKEPD
jgi:hypothetical protein